jgi:hypothetical protein
MTTQKDTVEEPRDYLVVFATSLGTGSWARGNDLEKAVQNCRRIAWEDWRDLFPKLAGAEVVLTLFDVTGQDRVSFGWGSCEGDNPDAPIVKLGTRTVTMPTRKRR